MTLPVFNLNGNRPEQLADQYFDAKESFEKFVSTLNKVDFHPRNYYDLYPSARAELDKIYQNLKEVSDYLDIHIQHCYENSKK